MRPTAPPVDIATHKKYHEQRRSSRIELPDRDDPEYGEGERLTQVFSETGESPRGRTVFGVQRGAEQPRLELDPNYAERMGAGMVQPPPGPPQPTTTDIFRCAVRLTWLAWAGFWKAFWGFR